MPGRSKADSSIDSVGVKVPAYFVSADIIAPNGEAVVGTWLTTEVTKAGLDLLGLASSQEIHDLDAGGRCFDSRDHYGDAGRQRVHQLCADWAREVASSRRFTISHNALDLRRRQALVSRRTVAARDGKVQQPKVDSELSAVVGRVCDDDAADEIGPRSFEHGVVTDAQCPSRSRVIPRHLLHQASQLRARPRRTSSVERRCRCAVGCGSPCAPSNSSRVSIMIPKPGSWAMWVASSPSDLDFSCGRQSSWPSGTRSSMRRVVFSSPSRSAKRRVPGSSRVAEPVGGVAV